MFSNYLIPFSVFLKGNSPCLTSLISDHYSIHAGSELTNPAIFQEHGLKRQFGSSAEGDFPAKDNYDNFQVKGLFFNK